MASSFISLEDRPKALDDCLPSCKREAVGVEVLTFSLGFVHPHDFRSPEAKEVVDALGEDCAASSAFSDVSDCLGDRTLFSGELEEGEEEMMAGEEGEGLKDLGLGAGTGDAVLVVSLFSGEAAGDGSFSASSGCFVSSWSSSSAATGGSGATLVGGGAGLFLARGGGAGRGDAVPEDERAGVSFGGAGVATGSGCGIEKTGGGREAAAGADAAGTEDEGTETDGMETVGRATFTTT